MALDDVLKNSILTVLKLKVFIDGKQVPVLQTIKITGSIQHQEDMLLTVDGIKYVTEDAGRPDGQQGLKTSTRPDDGVEIEATTLQEEAIARGGSRVVLKNIENDGNFTILNLVTIK